MIKNVIYSVGINFVNLLFPILLIPFYIKTFGFTNFGLIAISLSLINLISVICEYSWFVLAPIQLNILGNNTAEINKYISTIINTKFILFIPCLLLLFAATFLYPGLRQDWLFFISLFLFLLSKSQNTLSIFVGLDRVKPFFIINTVLKLSSIVLILFGLTAKTDFRYLFYILGTSDILISALSIFYLYLKCGYRYTISSAGDIFSELRIGLKVFLTNLLICALLNSSTLIIGFLFNEKAAGIFNVAEKIISICKLSINVLFQAVYHKACQVSASGTAQLNRFLNLVFKSYFGLYLFGVIILLLFPDLIISIFSRGEAPIESVHYLMYLAPIPLITALNQPAYMSLVLHDKKNAYFYSYLLGVIINVSLSFMLSQFIGVYGIVVSLIVTELFICLYLNYAIITNKALNFFRKTPHHEESPE